MEALVAGLNSTRLELFIEKATNSGDEPDWDSILHICEIIKQGNRSDVTRGFELVLIKLKDKNPIVAEKALQVLESIVKNCGSHGVYSELASITSSLHTLYKSSGLPGHIPFLRKLKTLLKTWATAFRNFPAYRSIEDTVESMAAQGVKFPEVKREDAELLFEKQAPLSELSVCFKCVKTLRFFSRHHCRACGQVFCSACTSKRAPLPHLGLPGTVRVCDPCFDKTTLKFSGSNGIDTLGALLKIMEGEDELQLALALSLSTTGEPAAVGKTGETSSVELCAGGSTITISKADTPAEGNALNGLDDEEMLTLEDFRENCYEKFSGKETIVVRRTNLLEDIVGLYKNLELDLFKKPHVIFDGEDGFDGGALTKEFFFCGMLAISNESLNGLPLFEGEVDHKIPSRDVTLLNNKAFESVGRFMVHSAIHTGIAFVGLSKAIVTYLLQGGSKFEITVEDVSDADVQLVKKLRNNELVTPEEMSQLRTAAINVGFNEPIISANATIVEETLLHEHVIEMRKRQLDELKKGFMNSEVSQFLLARPFLIEAVFPRCADLNAPASLVLSLIEVDVDSEEDETLCDHFKEFVMKLGEGSVKDATLRQLIELWTGSPDLRGSEKLRLSVDNIGYINVQACSNEIVLPHGLSRDTLFKQIYVAVAYASKGYGNESENLERMATAIQLLEFLTTALESSDSDGDSDADE